MTHRAATPCVLPPNERSRHDFACTIDSPRARTTAAGLAILGRDFRSWPRSIGGRPRPSRRIAGFPPPSPRDCPRGETRGFGTPCSPLRRSVTVSLRLGYARSSRPTNDTNPVRESPSWFPPRHRARTTRGRESCPVTRNGRPRVLLPPTQPQSHDCDATLPATIRSRRRTASSLSRAPARARLDQRNTTPGTGDERKRSARPSRIAGHTRGDEISPEKPRRARHTPRGSSRRYRLAGGGARRHDSARSSTTAPTKQPPPSAHSLSPSTTDGSVPFAPPCLVFHPRLPPPDVPRRGSRRLGPTNAILIGRKGGIQARNDFQRCPGHVPRVIRHPFFSPSSLFYPKVLSFAFPPAPAALSRSTLVKRFSRSSRETDSPETRVLFARPLVRAATHFFSLACRTPHVDRRVRLHRAWNERERDRHPEISEVRA